MGIGNPADDGTCAGRAATTASPPDSIEASGLIDPLATSPAIIALWTVIAAGAAVANVFAEPWLLLPALQRLDAARHARLALVRGSDGAGVGIAALGNTRRFGRLPIRCVTIWSHANGFLLSAQALAGRETTLWEGIFAAARSQSRAAPILLVSGIVDGSPLHHGLLAAARAHRLPVRVETRTVRAILATQLSPADYWDATVRPKKRKELRRQWARLGELGAVEVDHLSSTGDPEPWIAEFLALESSGWKGRGSSALASHADTESYFRDMMRGGHARGQVLVTALRLDGRAVAMLVTLLSGNAGFAYKTAFDENLARFSPGVLLQRESLAILARYRLDWIDSCAAQDHPMIDHLWRERQTVLSLALPLPGVRNRLIFIAAVTAQRLWHRLKILRPHFSDRPA